MKQTRNTPQRQMVRGLLIGNTSHPTAEEIFQLAKEQCPGISRGTVYRNLNLLAESGEIQRLPMPVGPDHFDFQTHPHYHFICRSCYRVLDAKLPYMEELNHETPEIPGCKAEQHRLLLIGLCPECNH